MENILKNILLVRIDGQKLGTAFAYKFNGKKILFSAKHLFLQSISKPNIDIEFLTPNSDFQKISGKLFKHQNERVDIIAIEFDDFPFDGLENSLPNIEPSYLSETFFIGFPFGIFDNSDANMIRPFIKKASVSGIRINDTIKTIYLDGHTNTGFSGGPIFIKEGDDYKIVSIMSGSQSDKKKWINPQDKSVIEISENSGIVITMDFKHALEIVKWQQEL